MLNTVVKESAKPANIASAAIAATVVWGGLMLFTKDFYSQYMDSEHQTSRENLANGFCIGVACLTVYHTVKMLVPVVYDAVKQQLKTGNFDPALKKSLLDGVGSETDSHSMPALEAKTASVMVANGSNANKKGILEETSEFNAAVEEEAVDTRSPAASASALPHSLSSLGQATMSVDVIASEMRGVEGEQSLESTIAEYQKTQTVRSKGPLARSWRRYASIHHLDTFRGVVVQAASVALAFGVVYGIAEGWVLSLPEQNAAKWIGYDPQLGNPEWTQSLQLAAILVATTMVAYELLGLIADRVMATEKVSNFMQNTTALKECCSRLFTPVRITVASAEETTELSVQQSVQEKEATHAQGTLGAPAALTAPTV